MTSALLTGGYFIGEHQSNIATIVQQEQELAIKQVSGKTTSYQRQSDGTYSLLEDRLPK